RLLTLVNGCKKKYSYKTKANQSGLLFPIRIMENNTRLTPELPSTLRYISDKVEGYTRVPRGKGYAFYYKGELVTDEAVLKRLKSLIIPPAWKNVWICPKQNGHLQVTGIDVKGRKQYLYHPEWQRLQHQNKFARIIDFGKALPCIRKNIKKDLRKKNYTLEKVVAIALEIMEQTLIRAGN